MLFDQNCIQKSDRNGTYLSNNLTNNNTQNIDKKFENGKMCEPWAEQVFFKYKTQNYFCL